MKSRNEGCDCDSGDVMNEEHTVQGREESGVTEVKGGMRGEVKSIWEL
jgi:hypothetical protein